MIYCTLTCSHPALCDLRDACLYLSIENGFAFRTKFPPTLKLKQFSSRPNSSLSATLFSSSFFYWAGPKTNTCISVIQDMPWMHVTQFLLHYAYAYV
jgi:hypothetical protein